MPASATASPARAWTSSALTGPGAGDDTGVVLGVAVQVRRARARRQAVTPLPVSTAAERERGGARVQGGMAQLLVAGIQHAAGNMSLAGIRARG